MRRGVLAIDALAPRRPTTCLTSTPWRLANAKDSLPLRSRGRTCDCSSMTSAAFTAGLRLGVVALPVAAGVGLGVACGAGAGAVCAPAGAACTGVVWPLCGGVDLPAGFCGGGFGAASGLGAESVPGGGGGSGGSRGAARPAAAAGTAPGVIELFCWRSMYLYLLRPSRRRPAHWSRRIFGRMKIIRLFVSRSRCAS